MVKKTNADLKLSSKTVKKPDMQPIGLNADWTSIGGFRSSHIRLEQISLMSYNWRIFNSKKNGFKENVKNLENAENSIFEYQTERYIFEIQKS